MKLLLGRPSTNEGRLEKEIRVYDLLDSLGIEYYRIDHAPAMCCDDCEEIEKVLDNVLCKNLFLCNRQETNFYVLMMPANKHFKTSEVSKQIGSSRLSFANSEYMERFLDVTPGSVSIMGLMNDKENNVQLLVDEDVLRPEYVGCHPCINTSSIRLKTKDMFEKYLPAVNHSYIVVHLTGE
jgi:Ala-tRNA(Pro) deacylase